MRIRSVKPEYWRSADTAELDMFTRLLFIGLWNYVDDNGVGEDDVSLIRSDLFPREPNVDELSGIIHGALTELSSKGQITRYIDSVSGRRYIHVSSWHHQRINRPTDSTKPLPTSKYCELIEGSLSLHGAHGDDSLLEGIKGAGNKGGESDNPPPRFCPKHPNGTDKPCWACKRCREEEDARRAAAESSAAEEKQRRQRERAAAIRACRLCDELGRREVGDDRGTLAKCNHQEAVNG